MPKIKNPLLVEIGQELVAYLLALTANGAVEAGEAMKLARQEFGRNVDRSLRRAREAAGITHTLAVSSLGSAATKCAERARAIIDIAPCPI